MGVIDPGVRCETCGNKHEECPSHFGHIALELPIMHIGFTDLIKMSLKSTCNSCSKILLHDQPNTHPLDPEKSEKIITLLKEINLNGTTVVIATHDYAIIKKHQARTIKCADQKIIEVDVESL